MVTQQHSGMWGWHARQCMCRIRSITLTTCGGIMLIGAAIALEPGGTQGGTEPHGRPNRFTPSTNVASISDASRTNQSDGPIESAAAILGLTSASDSTDGDGEPWPPLVRVKE